MLFSKIIASAMLGFAAATHTVTVTVTDCEVPKMSTPSTTSKASPSSQYPVPTSEMEHGIPAPSYASSKPYVSEPTVWIPYGKSTTSVYDQPAPSTSEAEKPSSSAPSSPPPVETTEKHMPSTTKPYASEPTSGKATSSMPSASKPAVSKTTSAHKTWATPTESVISGAGKTEYAIGLVAVAFMAAVHL